jgi:predicted peptidase
MIYLNFLICIFEEIDPIIIAPDCPGQYWRQEEREELILDLLAEIKSTYNIAGGSTLITRYSLGSIGTWYYAGRYPNYFSAAVITAGRLPGCAGSQQVTMLPL